ncbi:cysteine proteinase inhibitor 6-like [Silene latifolia]|uniref:cysteine proteinase inhibitor 6-like n=1 Tax=Silene latifolia TaxID=37657 RepID=UPI003D7732FD
MNRISSSISRLNNNNPKISHLIISLILIFILFSNLNREAIATSGYCTQSSSSSSSNMATLGGVRESQGTPNDLEIESLARFAVNQHNTNQNATLEFGRVIKAKEQTVAGTLHHLTIEAVEASKKKLYEAKVWVKPWLDFKELQEFKHVGDSPSFTPSDLGACREGHAPGWKEVPNHDPEVQNAANHALKTIQQRSNSLFPYELQEVVHAKAEVAEDSAKFNLRLKVKRGEKDEDFNVEVHKNSEGVYRLHEFGSIQPEH